jgi:C-terminal processing protease CtpA/Prc
MRKFVLGAFAAFGLATAVAAAPGDVHAQTAAGAAASTSANTAIERDREFDAGSRVVIGTLTPAQVENLALLGKVWGFLKYHHPAVTTGARHWDYDLFRVMPAVLAASDRTAGAVVLRDWIDRLGPIPPCNPCLTPTDDNLQLRPRLDLLESDAIVGRELAERLRAIHRGRSSGEQFYVQQSASVGNALFNSELAYAELKFPDAGYQLLALFRYWNIIEYWFPYRDLIDEKWDDVLAEFIPRFARANDKNAYQLEILQLLAKVDDTHADPRISPELRPPAGPCQLPVTIRFLGEEAVVSGSSDDVPGHATWLRAGDVIAALDGVPVAELVKRMEPFTPASNRPARLHKIARRIGQGECVQVRVEVRRADEGISWLVQRQPIASLNQRAGATHDRPGEAFRLLSNEVAYLKLSAVKLDEALSYVERAKGTSGFVLDLRNYPSAFMVFALGGRMVEKATPFARFSAGDLAHPGAFRWGPAVTLTPMQPFYSGKVVVIVDEVTLSSAEYTSMAFRANPRAIVVGSTTAAADGNVSPMKLPGDIDARITGIGVFYPDKTPTQRIGIVPDVQARPTIAGIRAGRDEVLEEAIRQILGPDAPARQIEQMAKPPQ